MENLKVIVKRSEWLRGGKSFLFREEDCKRCCLGFAGLALGHSDEEMKNKEVPWTIRSFKSKSWPLQDNCALVYRYYDLFVENDLEYDEIYSKSIEDFNKNKEENIKILGQRIGFDFEFVD